MNVALTICMNSIIPDPNNLKNHNVYIFSGTKDTIVSKSIFIIVILYI